MDCAGPVNKYNAAVIIRTLRRAMVLTGSFFIVIKIPPGMIANKARNMIARGETGMLGFRHPIQI